MKAILFANIGNRDLGKNGTPEYKLGNNIDIYDNSKQLFENKKFDFDAILLEPTINYINEKHSLESIYLFGTEQINYNSKDTIYIAKIIKEILKHKYRIEDKNIKVIQITKNPSDRDGMYDFYQEFFKDEDFKDKEVFISLTGGTPAQNEALLFESVAKFKLNVQAVYLPKDSKEVRELSIGEKIYKKGLIDQINAFKEKDLYEGAIELVERHGLGEDLDLLKAENYRNLFDFENSLKYYNNALQKYSGEKRAEIQGEIEAINELKGGLNKKEFSEKYFLTYRTLLKELCRNMKIKWRQGAYVDFVGRLFRFEEAFLRFVFESKYKVSTKKDKNGKHLAFKEFIESNDNVKLKGFLDEAKIKPENPNRRVLFMILTFLKKENPNWDELKKVHGIISKIEELADLRNKSILGHGFEGISKDKFEKEYNRDILGDINSILEFIKDYNTR